MDSVVTLRAGATPSAPALELRPWGVRDVDALVEVVSDPAFGSWTGSPVVNAADGTAWVREQRLAWEAGTRFGFAVREVPPGAAAGPGRLVGGVSLKEVAPGKASAEVGYWTAAHARGRGVASRALDAVTGWAFDAFGADGPGFLEFLELLHQEDNRASCGVARKGGYAFDRILPAAPPAFPLDGHLHVRRRGTS
ncbi:GNAT family N-acetyltransferase [Streptomyces sp. NPDC057939]|uniref:GNAT family N-acetyltransferase n=1 Tax=Streptomyces sp. NPDC057939 TaxID=3346284 RepID=UPI0036EEDEAC